MTQREVNREIDMALNNEINQLRAALREVLGALGALDKPHELNGWGITQQRAEEILFIANEK